MDKQAYEEPTVELVELDSEEITAASLDPKKCSLQDADAENYNCFHY